jgi:hypothetical protein
VPTVELPPAVEFTLQVTLVLDVPVTVAVNCCVAPVCTLAEVGDIVTITGGAGAVMVTVADADFEESAALVAATVTVFGLGTDVGAV